MTTKRIGEAATLRVDPTTKALRVCLITEGAGSTADFPRSFFVPENGQRLAKALSFPGHPQDWDHPEWRDPLTAIARIGENVTLETDPETGKLGFWSDYVVAKSRPDVKEYLEEFGEALGLSVFGDTNGHEEGGRWVAESFAEVDPYRSVDLVVAAGRGGKFARVAESLRKIAEASAFAGEKENLMEIEKEVAELKTSVGDLVKVVEGLVGKIDGKARAELQVEADDAAVAKAVESRLSDYDKAVGLISEAKLPDEVAATLRASALKGEDIEPTLAIAKKVAEAAASGTSSDAHLGGGQNGAKGFSPFVPGFGEAR